MRKKNEKKWRGENAPQTNRNRGRKQKGGYRKEEILQEKDTGRSSCKGEKMQNDRNAATEK